MQSLLYSAITSEGVIVHHEIMRGFQEKMHLPRVIHAKT